jgi:hypothetical protein
MILLYSVETQDSHIRLSRHAMVCLLVCAAILANVWASQRVAEMKRDLAFREQLGRNLNSLMNAADQIARKRQEQVN